MEAVQILVELATERKIVAQILCFFLADIFAPFVFFSLSFQFASIILVKLIFRNVERGGI